MVPKVAFVRRFWDREGCRARLRGHPWMHHLQLNVLLGGAAWLEVGAWEHDLKGPVPGSSLSASWVPRDEQLFCPAFLSWSQLTMD